MRFVLLLLLLLNACFLWGQPPRPATATWVVDEAHILMTEEEAFLTQQIEYLEQQSSIELVIATVPSLDGANLEMYTQDWAESWGIGKAEKDNGLLLLVALEDRKMRLHTGYGLEARITDLSARRLLDNNLKPNFRRKAYFEGFKAFLTDLFRELDIVPSPQMLSAITPSAPIARRDSSGGVILPSGVPAFEPPSVWDPDTLLSDSTLEILDEELHHLASGYSAKELWVVLLKELPSGYTSLNQYVDSLQAGWMVAYPDTEKQALMVYHVGLDSLTYRKSEGASFIYKAELAYSRILEPMRPLGVSRAITWSLHYLFDDLRGHRFDKESMEKEVFRLTDPDGYAREQAHQARIAAFDAWLNWGQPISVILLFMMLFSFVARMRTRGRARAIAAKLLRYLIRFYVLLALARFIGVALHPEPFWETLTTFFLLEILLLFIAFMFSSALLGGGSSGGGFSSGSSYSGGSSSFGGGSFGGGGASSSW